MLEIIAVTMLLTANKKNALMRGRNPWPFAALGLILWFLFEVFGFFLGAVFGEGEFTPYLTGILCAALGGLLSYLISKNCKIGNYKTRSARAIAAVVDRGELLNKPALLRITREKSFAASFATCPIALNGMALPPLKNGESIEITTNQKQNVLTTSYTSLYGAYEQPPYLFNVEDGGHAQLFLKASSIQWKKSMGVLPSDINL